jgi:peptidoglycan/xylan/chitin deacetylase (PgdA/CDA1 family)
MPLRTVAKTVVKRGIVLAASRVARTPGMRCLLYHHVTGGEDHDPGELTVSVRLFERQCAYLRDKGYRVTGAAEAVTMLRSGADLARSVVLTFDDGYVDTHTNAVPILERFRFPATVFVVADAMVDGATPVAGKKYFNVAAAREIVAGGLVTIGCHSATHANLRGLSDDALRRETVGAKQRIEDALGVPVRLFAYPFGSYDAWDRRVRDAVQAAGFEAAFTSISSPNGGGEDPFLLRRYRVSWAEELPYFSRMLTGGYDWHAGWQKLRAQPPA